MNRNLFVSICVFCVSVGLAGCQSQPAEDVTETQTDLPELAVPFSRGPSSPPYVQGPTSPPPGSTDTVDAADVTVTSAGEEPQAVTETEEITISFPSETPFTSPPTQPPGE